MCKWQRVHRKKLQHRYILRVVGVFFPDVLVSSTKSVDLYNFIHVSIIQSQSHQLVDVNPNKVWGTYYEFIMRNNLRRVYSKFVTCSKTSSTVLWLGDKASTKYNAHIEVYRCDSYCQSSTFVVAQCGFELNHLLNYTYNLETKRIEIIERTEK